MTDLRRAALPLIALIMVAVALIMPSPSPSEPPRRPSSVDVTQSSYACPAGSGITVASGQLSAGTSSTAVISPGGARGSALEDASAWRTSVVRGSGVIIEQKGRRSGPAGFFAGTAPKQDGGGLVVGPCPGPVDDAWLLGLGSGARHFSSLVLTNLGDSPASVDLSLWGPQGPVDAVDADGVVVKPFSVRRIRIDELAAGEAELALHVHRRRGSLSAVVNDTSRADLRGTEPVTATATPSRTQIIGGVVEGDRRTLMILNPGTATARVDVEVIGPSNTFSPSGLEQIKVDAGSLREVELPRSAGSARQALRLTSDLPVAAAVRMAPGTRDYAYAESVPALNGPTIVPVDLGRRIPPDLVLTAPGPDATVEVEAVDAFMRRLSSTTVRIKAGTTTHLDTGGKELRAGAAAYLVLRPRGAVVAAATYVVGDGVSSLALTAVPLRVLGPQVRPVS